MKSLRTIVTLALVGCIAGGLYAQERRGPGGARRPGRTPQAPEAAEKPASKKVERWLALVGGDVHVGNGDVLRRATVLIGDDKISAVGPDLEIPQGATVIDTLGKVVAPGFVAVKASGMGIPARVTGETKDAVNPYDPTIKMGLAAGITSCLASFDRGSSTPGGHTAVIKLAYGKLDEMVVSERTTYSMRLPLSREQWKKLRELVERVKSGKKSEDDEKEDSEGDKASEEKKEGDDKAQDKPSKSRSNSKADRDKAVKAVLAGEARLWVSSERGFGDDEIRQALEIARLIGHGVVLDDPVTAWTVPNEIAATGSMVVLNPRNRRAEDPGRPGRSGTNPTAAARLAEAGVAIAVTPPSGRFGGASLGTGGILGQDLHTLALDAAHAVRGGLDNRKGLRTITLDAARIAGIETRVGSLEPGKDADVLILDGDPLHYRTFVEVAIVNGRITYEKSKEPFYSHIKR